MRTAAPRREGRDHDILVPGAGALAAALLLGALTAALQSQPVLAQGGVPCTAIDDDKERLACYDRALRAAAPATPAPTAPAAQATTSPPAQAAPAQSNPAAAPAAEAAAAPAPGGDADERVVAVVIVGVRALPGRETTFTAEDGSIWVQTDSQRVVGLPATPFAAEIKSGAMGSNFLVPKDRGRAIRVRAADR
jgi:hypothetical protein